MTTRINQICRFPKDFLDVFRDIESEFLLKLPFLGCELLQVSSDVFSLHVLTDIDQLDRGSRIATACKPLQCLLYRYLLYRGSRSSAVL